MAQNCNLAQNWTSDWNVAGSVARVDRIRHQNTVILCLCQLNQELIARFTDGNFAIKLVREQKVVQDELKY